MTLNLKKHKNDLLFLPLGGSGEIGMNMNLYHMQDKWLMVDFGAGFAEEFLPGVDMILPEIEFIVERKKDLVGLVLTHAHEDHLGAIPHLWEELQCPIYATPFTAAFLRAKLSENGVSEKLYEDKIIEVQPGSRFKVGPFEIEMVQLTHSVPEMNAVVLRTPHGNIMHTGDWKLDPDPVVGPTTDEKRLKEYGDEGVLAMVCDSTNVFKEGHSGSEGELHDVLTQLIADAPRMVLVTTFASNVARIDTIARAAHDAGRKVVLAGRSFWRVVRAAQETGYLEGMEFLTDKEMGNYPREDLVVLCTGCQGEPLAAMNKILTETHRSIRLNPNDTVIFSSKIIPGNDKRIFRMFNRLTRMGVNVMTEKDHFVHVSGHPSRDELQRMYELVRPKIAVPVHGENVHIHEHARLAREWGAKTAFEIENGQVLKLAPGMPEKVALVESGILAIDGKFYLPPDSPIMKARRRMQREGIVMVTLFMQGKELIATPVIKAPGALDHQEDAELIEILEEEVREAIEHAVMTSKPKSMQELLENKTRAAIRRVLRRELGKDPLIMVHIEKLNKQKANV